MWIYSNIYRRTFECILLLILLGEDPLKDVKDAKYVHAAAGVLRCYFRELQTPLFPSSILEDLVECLSMWRVIQHELITLIITEI